MQTSELDQLKEKMMTCQSCGLCENRTNVVFGEGKTKNPPLMIIGEAPGESEDLSGKPFDGAAGQKLDQILQFLNISRDEIFITNTTLCRPPNNRTPLIEEMDACRWRLHLQIKLIQPKLLVLLGRSALTTMLGKEFKGPLNQFFTDNFLEFNIDNQVYKAITTYHPSYLLRKGKTGSRMALPHWTKVKEWFQNESK